MDLTFTPDELAFRDEVRTFLAQSLPDATRQRVLEGMEVSRDDTLRWQRILHQHGWGGPTGRRNSAAPAGTRCASSSSRRRALPPARRACCPSA